LFEKHSPSETTLDRIYGVAGIGLFISKKLAQSINGDLYLARSEEGLGSTFVLEVSLK